MDGKYEYEQAQVSHHQRFDDFKSAYDEFVLGIPDPLKVNVTKNYAKQIECLNRDPNINISHTNEKQVTWKPMTCSKRMILGLIFVVFMLTPLWDYLYINTATYYLEPTENYKIPMKTKEYGIEFYVKSIGKFNKKYPQGTPGRAQIEDTIVNDYIYMERRYCSVQLYLRSLKPEKLTPDCDKLQSLGIHI